MRLQSVPLVEILVTHLLTEESRYEWLGDICKGVEELVAGLDCL
jgi:hypothetical protein